MNPTTLLLDCATSTSRLRIALLTDSSRPDSGFQSNHSERRPSTAGASVIRARRMTRSLVKPHRGPSWQRRIDLPAQDKALPDIAKQRAESRTNGRFSLLTSFSLLG